MRKTHHILHGAISLLTIGLWIPGWTIIALRNWSHNELESAPAPKQVAPAAPVESFAGHSGGGFYFMVEASPSVQFNATGAAVAAAPKEFYSPPRYATDTQMPGAPATYLPKSRRQLAGYRAEVDPRHFELDQELTKMFEEIGVTDPTDMQKIIDAALADTATKSPKNRLLLSFGGYAKKLIQEQDLQINRADA